LFEQWRQDHIIYSELYPQLFKLVFLEMKRIFWGLVLLGADDEWPVKEMQQFIHEGVG